MLSNPFSGGESIASGTSYAEQIRSEARQTLRLRSARARHFGADLFGEPAWDILLLFASQSPQATLSLDEITQTFGYAPSVVQRWLDILQDRGQIQVAVAADAGIYRLSAQAWTLFAEVFAIPER